MRAQHFDKSPLAYKYGEPWTPLPLIPAHERVWEQRRAIMLWAVAAFADIWYGMMVDEKGEHAFFTDKVKTAATDDQLMYINPDYYFKLTNDEATFVKCHEVMHAMYGHAGTMWALTQAGKIIFPDGSSLPVDNECLQYAADYIINDQLIKAGIGKMPEGGLHAPELVDGDMDLFTAYRKVYKASNQGKNKKKACRTSQGNKRTMHSDGEGTGKPEQQGAHMRPGEGQGKSPKAAVDERKQAQWEAAIEGAMAAAAGRGQLPENLKRIFLKQLAPKADWRDLYQVAVGRRVGDDRYTWERLEQELIYRGIGAPARHDHSCELVVVARDTSGSVTPRTIETFGAETRSVLERARPRRIVIVDCDARVNRWEDVDDLDMLEKFNEMRGGGGTSFHPVFERIQQEGLEPDVLIYLTDGDCWGAFPPKPSYPVIWGDISNTPSKYPYGDVVCVPQASE